jgi:hypothetical protein
VGDDAPCSREPDRTSAVLGDHRPNKPSGTWFLNLVMISLLIFGTMQLFDDGNQVSQLLEIPVLLAFLAAGLVPSVIHNRRVGRSV